MRRLAVVLTLALIPAAAFAQSPPDEIENTSAQSVIEASERAWATALVSQDHNKIAILLDPRFQLIMSINAASSDRDDYLKLSEERAYTSMTPDIVSIVVDADVAVATIDMKVGWPEGFPDLHADWRFTDTWLRSAGTWYAVTRIAQPLTSDTK